EVRPQLVTFNGNGFDLPVLRYRAMVNRVSAQGLQVRPYFHRGTDDALDLCDVLESHAAGAKLRVDELSRILGLTFKPNRQSRVLGFYKPDAIDSSRVEELVLAGQIETVAHYCESDVLNAYRIWLVYELFRGSITREEFRWSEDRILHFLS